MFVHLSRKAGLLRLSQPARFTAAGGCFDSVPPPATHQAAGGIVETGLS